MGQYFKIVNLEEIRQEIVDQILRRNEGAH